MDEFSFIKSIQPKSYRHSNLIKGIGDDAAVLRQTSKDFVTAVDVFVEGIHFTKETMSPFQIGFRALAANLSDLAAMGATPTSMLVAVVIPETWSTKEIGAVFDGVNHLAHIFQVDLIGGDTVSGAAFTLSITVIGDVEKDKARYRSDAKDGDIVFVTGNLGDSRAGFHMLTEPGPYENKNYFINRHQMPMPRIKFADALSTISRLSLNDISDGIANEAREVAEASNVSLFLYDEMIPINTSLQQFPSSLQHQWKYFGGEDFELVGTVSPNEWSAVQGAAEQTNTKITRVGYVTLNESDQSKIYLIKKNKEKIELNKEGYTHLK